MSDTPAAGDDTPTWPGGAGPYDQPYERPAQGQPAGPYNAPGQPQYSQPYSAPAPRRRRSGNEIPPRTRTMLGIAHLITLVVSIVEAFLIIRIVLMLLGANPDAPFTNWIYSWTAPLVAPFQDIFVNASTRGHVLDAAAVVAVVVYAIFGALVEGIARWLAHL